MEIGGPTGLTRNGKPVGWLENTGYYRTTVGGRKKLNHIIIYEMLNGPIPAGMEVDHRDGVRTNNDPSNFRLLTKADNLANMKGTGVYRDKSKWAVGRMHRGIRYRVSGFSTREDALEFSGLLASELKGELYRG